MSVFQEQGREGYFPPHTSLVSVSGSEPPRCINSSKAETLVFLQAGMWRVNRKGITFLRDVESRQKFDILATFNYFLCFQH